MPRYAVTLIETIEYDLVIEAGSAEEAQSLAEEGGEDAALETREKTVLSRQVGSVEEIEDQEADA